MSLDFLSVPTNKPKITFICDEETRAYLEAWAEEEGRSLSNLVEQIVKRVIKQRKDEQGK
ncbi:MAG: hypothetical protein SNJ57_18120 [Cyanobacteriota bacterium]